MNHLINKYNILNENNRFLINRIMYLFINNSIPLSGCSSYLLKNTFSYKLLVYKNIIYN